MNVDFLFILQPVKKSLKIKFEEAGEYTVYISASFSIKDKDYSYSDTVIYTAV